jgi:hypothetical protein
MDKLTDWELSSAAVTRLVRGIGVLGLALMRQLVKQDEVPAPAIESRPDVDHPTSRDPLGPVRKVVFQHQDTARLDPGLATWQSPSTSSGNTGSAECSGRFSRFASCEQSKSGAG